MNHIGASDKRGLSRRSFCSWYALLALYMSLILPLHAAVPLHQEQVIAYIFPRDKVIAPGQVSAKRLTRINYAFANIQNGKIVEGSAHDAENFAALNSLKQDNPLLTVVVSVGGWAWSGDFTDMALTKNSRSLFIDSVVSFIQRYNLDGLDIDWEYPGMAGNNHRFRAEDKQNYTLLLKELRKRFDHEQKKLHRHLIASIATGASEDFLQHTEMGEVQRYVDSVNLMSYDYYVPAWDKTTGHHAPLFTNPSDPKKISADRTVHEYEVAGVPAHKLVLGVPFYGKSWGQVADQNHGLFQLGTQIPNNYLPYGVLDNLLNTGYTRYWDPIASAPYLYNPDARIFVTYDDPQSLALKCKYVLDQKLGGIMFWEYSGDPTGKLVDTIDTGLQRNSATTTETR
jgi:chitinase